MPDATPTAESARVGGPIPITPRADSHECRGAFRFASLFVNFGVEDLPDAAPGDSVQPPSPAWIIEVFGRR